MTTYNWDQLRSQAASGPELLPKGEYVATPKKATAKKTNDGAKDMVVVQFEIVAGPAAGKTVWNNFVLSPENANALGFFFEHMAALGISDAAFAQQPTFETIASWVEHLARPVVLSVSHRQFQGQLRNQVDGVRPYGGDGMAAVPPAPGAVTGVAVSPPMPAAPPPPPAAPVVPVAPPAPAPVAAAPPPPPVPVQGVTAAFPPPPLPGTGQPMPPPTTTTSAPPPAPMPATAPPPPPPPAAPGDGSTPF